MNPHAKEDKARIDQIISDIKRSMTEPNFKPQTSGHMRERANRLRDVKTAIKLAGGKVKDGYR